MKALVAGWFSFELMGASAGDLMARDVACDWLREAGLAYDLALAPPFTGGVDWRAVDPQAYSHVLFVCGPFGNGGPIPEFLERFAGRRFIGLNLTMLHQLAAWNPFDLLLERDSDGCARPDMAFACRQGRVPVVGMIVIDSQPEYGSRDMHDQANAALRRVAAGREMSIVPIDTRLDENKTGLRIAAEVESLIARMDAVLTTRLHGMVLALKNGVPAVALDPVAGGAKIERQARALHWPLVFVADQVNQGSLENALDFCLTDAGRARARECTKRAQAALLEAKSTFLARVR
jgi:hypothetical protein